VICDVSNCFLREIVAANLTLERFHWRRDVGYIKIKQAYFLCDMIIVVSVFAILLGLMAAARWGAGDFCGGWVSKRISVYLVVLVSQFVGLVILLIFTLVTVSEIPSAGNIVLGGLAGLCGGFGLMTLY
jgi:hypothetical protein